MTVSRRDFVQIAGAAALVAPFQGFVAPAQAQSGPRFRFGVVADPQYAAVVPNLELQRYYSNTLWKLSAAVTEFNKQDLSFVVTLGDIIDREYESFGKVLPLYDKLKAERFFLLGNHDYQVAADYLGSVLRTAGMPKAHYDFTGGGYRFVVLDQNEITLFANPVGSKNHTLAKERLAAMQAAGKENAKPYNGSMGDEQYAWLKATLAKAEAAKEKVIVMGHYPIFPAHESNLLDADHLVDVLTGSPSVVAYFNGHNHKGNYGEKGGKHFLNFCGMVDTPDTTAYSFVEVYDDRIEIVGFGREPKRTLKI